jgi:hypothetical protein
LLQYNPGELEVRIFVTLDVRWLSEFLALLAAGLFGTLCAIPYSTSIVTAAGRDARVSSRRRISLQFALSAFLLAICIGFGLRAAHLMGLGAPLLEALASHRPIFQVLSPMLLPAVLGGLSGAVFALITDTLFFSARLPVRVWNLPSEIPFWQRFLACLYGGITEEIITRLFVFSSLAWLLFHSWRHAAVLSGVELWFVNVVTATIFGLGHLPATRALVGLTAVTVTRALVLNGVPGLIFGWLYWRYGLEAAMIAHFCADVFIQSAGSFLRPTQRPVGGEI